jgi:hypothetical protein
MVIGVLLGVSHTPSHAQFSGEHLRSSWLESRLRRIS